MVKMKKVYLSGIVGVLLFGQLIDGGIVHAVEGNSESTPLTKADNEKDSSNEESTAEATVENPTATQDTQTSEAVDATSEKEEPERVNEQAVVKESTPILENASLLTSSNVAPQANLIPDSGLQAILNLNLNQDVTTELTQDMLTSLQTATFDKVTESTTVSDYTNLNLAGNLTNFGTSNRSYMNNAANVTLTNLTNFVTVAASMPTLQHVDFDWVNVPDITPLANLFGNSSGELSLKIEPNKDYSALNQLLVGSKLDLVYDHGVNGSKKYQTQIDLPYKINEGTMIAEPFVLPTGLYFDYDNAVIDGSWTYENGKLINPNIKEGDTGYIMMDVPIKGTNANHLSFGSSQATPTLGMIYQFHNLKTIDGQDVTKYVGENVPEDSEFAASATDIDGNSLQVTLDKSQVDMTTPGDYDVILATADGQTKTVQVHVLESKSKVITHDSVIYEGDSWKAEDNFDGATTVDGKPIDFSGITVSGTVNTTKPGEYQVTYEAPNAKSTAKITVKQDQTALQAKNSVIYLGDTWKAQDNFISATDKDGNNVAFSAIGVTGTVNTTQVGSYDIVYQNGKLDQKVTVQVIQPDVNVAAPVITQPYAGATSLKGKVSELGSLATSGTVPLEYHGTAAWLQINGVLNNTVTTYSVDANFNFELTLPATIQLKANDTIKLIIPGTPADASKYGQMHYSWGEVTVLANQASIQAKDSTITVGDTWTPKDNFVSATDDLGNPVDFSAIQVSGTVDTTTAGVYEITYDNQGVKQTIKVTVVANQASIKAKDSTITVGDTWTAKDNFVSATDKAGNPVEFNAIQVSGTVDTTTAGVYEITYDNQGTKQTIKVTVVANQTSIEAKDSTITVGDTWTAKDNFVSATDKAGNPVEFNAIQVSGTVDTTTAGIYEITYDNQGVKQTIKVTVVANQASIKAKDSTITVGDTWTAKDNFVSATDKAGNPVELSAIQVSGTVDTTTAGVYEITYDNQGVKQTIKVMVKEKTTSGDKEEPTEPIAPINPSKPTTPSTTEPEIKEKSKSEDRTKQELFPQTGEAKGNSSLLGLIGLVMNSAIGFYLLRKRK